MASFPSNATLAYKPSFNQNDHSYLSAAASLSAIATVFVGIRIWLRIDRRFGVGLDDWVLLAAFPFMWGTFVVFALNFVFVNELSKMKQLLWSGELLFFTCNALTKWSVLAMYYRIFHTRFMKWGYVVLGAMTAGWYISAMVAGLLQCIPLRSIWDFSVKGTCLPPDGFRLGVGGIPTMVTDILILLLPLREVYKLHISKSQKIAIAGSFLVGGFVVISSIMKLVTLIEFHNGPVGDVTYKLAEGEFWVSAECATGIISACLPTMRPLLSMCLRRLGVSVMGTDPRKRSVITFGRGGVRRNQECATIDSSDDMEIGRWREQPTVTKAQIADWNQELQTSWLNTPSTTGGKN